MQRIDALTDAQKAHIPAVRDEWLRIGLSTERANRPAAQRAIAAAYKEAGLPPPRIWIWLDSPWAGAIAAAILTNKLVWDQVWDQVGAQVGDQVWAQVGAQVWDQVRDQVGAQVRDQVGAQVWDQVGAQVGDQVWAQVGAQVWAQVWDQVWAQVWDQVRDQVGAQVGAAVYSQHDAGWLSFYDFFRRYMPQIAAASRLHPLIDAAQNTGWWWPFADACIITERPVALKRDAQHRLHCEDGPALAYPDGWSIYAWHGLRIPASFITDRDKISVDQIGNERNAEHKRILVDLYGRDRYLVDTGANPISQDKFGILWRSKQENAEDLMFVEVENATIEHGTRRKFFLRVPPNMKTAHEAVAWTFYKTPKTYQPSIEA